MRKTARKKKEMAKEGSRVVIRGVELVCGAVFAYWHLYPSHARKHLPFLGGRLDEVKDLFSVDPIFSPWMILRMRREILHAGDLARFTRVLDASDVQHPGTRVLWPPTGGNCWTLELYRHTSLCFRRYESTTPLKELRSENLVSGCRYRCQLGLAPIWAKSPSIVCLGSSGSVSSLISALAVIRPTLQIAASLGEYSTTRSQRLSLAWCFSHRRCFSR